MEKNHVDMWRVSTDRCWLIQENNLLRLSIQRNIRVFRYIATALSQSDSVIPCIHGFKTRMMITTTVNDLSDWYFIGGDGFFSGSSISLAVSDLARYLWASVALRQSLWLAVQRWRCAIWTDSAAVWIMVQAASGARWASACAAAWSGSWIQWPGYLRLAVQATRHENAAPRKPVEISHQSLVWESHVAKRIKKCCLRISFFSCYRFRVLLLGWLWSGVELLQQVRKGWCYIDTQVPTYLRSIFFWSL